MKRVVSSFLFVLIVSVALPLAMMAERDGATPSNVVEVKNTIISMAAADISVDKERSSVSSSWIIKLFTPHDMEQKKKLLIEELKRRTKADIILDPQFTLTKTRLGGGKITLSGYPAHYTNFRNLTPAETDSLIIHNKYTAGSIIFFDKSELPTQ